MPELPDVEVMRRYLQSTALHQEITDLEVGAARLIPDEETNQDPTVKQLKADIIGRSFESSRRHGKWLFIRMNSEGEKFLVFHFGMTGGLKYFKDMDDEPEYTQVLFHFKNGYQLAYISQRKLGELEIIDGVEKFVDQKKLGPDALDLSLEEFKTLCEGRHAMVKTTLMDQSKIAGIGNVYSDEILFQAKIYPRTQCDQLGENKIEELYRTMKDVLQTAIDCQADPEQLPQNFITPHRHKGGHCPICGEALKRVQVGSRHAYYCPNRQEKKGKH